MRNQEKRYILARLQFIKLVWDSVEFWKAQKLGDHTAANGVKSRYGELMTERKSMDQNVEHLSSSKSSEDEGRIGRITGSLLLMWN